MTMMLKKTLVNLMLLQRHKLSNRSESDSYSNNIRFFLPSTMFSSLACTIPLIALLQSRITFPRLHFML